MKTNEFKTYHPIVNFIYFVFVIGFSCVFMHPVCLLISCVSAFSYSLLIGGKKALRKNLIYMLPTVTVMAVMNPAFNHEGVTILAYLPSGNPLTLESVVYGLAAGVMIVSVICWFSCYNEVMTSDKFIYLFGKIIPSMSLILSMTLRFVPKFSAQLKTVTNAQRCIGRDMSDGSIIKRAKNGITILSILVTWSLENAIETADSMKSRGYGLPGRTAFSIFTFDQRDRYALYSILILGIYVLIGAVRGGMYFKFFPNIKQANISFYGISIFTAYLILSTVPIIIELWEVRKWKAIESKI